MLVLKLPSREMRFHKHKEQLNMSRRFVFAACFLLFANDLLASPDAPALIEVRLTQTSAVNPPVGCNEFGDPGGTMFSAGNLIPDSGFEPMSLRFRWRVMATGMESGHPWAEVDGGGLTDWDLTTTAFLNGADVRIYRLVDALGQPLPQDPAENYLNLSNAASYALMGTTTVPNVGEPGLPYGGWVNTVYTVPGPVWGTRANLDFTDARWVENGHTYYYIVTAIGNNTSDSGDGNESDQALAVEVTATPLAGLVSGPQVYARSGDGFNEISSVTANGWMSFMPAIAGATGPVTWTLLDTNGVPLTTPFGLGFNPITGELSGSPTNTPPATRLRFQATAANGTVYRDVILNNPAWATTGGTNRPTAPGNVTATAGDGFVHLTWTASPTPGVVGYRIYRADVPRSQQHQRVYLSTNAPALLKDDYLHFAKRILTADPMWAHPRVRTGTVGETWRGDGITFQRVPHPGTVPTNFLFRGESCLQATSPQAGWREIGGP